MRIYKQSIFTLFVLGTLVSCSTSTVKQSPHLGQAMTVPDIKKVDISIGPDGVGLPIGSGNAKAGQKVYEAQCSSCHGVKGQGKPVDALVGGIGSLSSDKPIRTVGSFWPYASTLFDYTRRAMPLQSPKSLTNNEVYAVSAYILFLNGSIGENDELNQQNLAQVKMPNRDGMIDFSKEKSVVYK